MIPLVPPPSTPSTPSSPSTSPPSSCLSCRLTGGFTLLVLAGLVGSARDTAKSPVHRALLIAVSGGLGWLSLAKVANLPPFPPSAS